MMVIMIVIIMMVMMMKLEVKLKLMRIGRLRGLQYLAAISATMSSTSDPGICPLSRYPGIQVSRHQGLYEKFKVAINGQKIYQIHFFQLMGFIKCFMKLAVVCQNTFGTLVKEPAWQ